MGFNSGLKGVNGGTSQGSPPPPTFWVCYSHIGEVTWHASRWGSRGPQTGTTGGAALWLGGHSLLADRRGQYDTAIHMDLWWI